MPNVKWALVAGDGTVENISEWASGTTPPGVSGKTYVKEKTGAEKGGTYGGSTFTRKAVELVTVSSEMVKDEAMRRILATVPEWKQRNLTARAAIMAKKVADGGTLTTSEATEWADGESIWNQVDAIRSASDALEATSPIPTNYTDASHWP